MILKDRAYEIAINPKYNYRDLSKQFSCLVDGTKKKT